MLDGLSKSDGTIMLWGSKGYFARGVGRFPTRLLGNVTDVIEHR